MSKIDHFNGYDEVTRDLAERVRHELARYEDIHSVDLDISISGRIDGDLKITYRMSLNYEPSTKGGHLLAVFNEAVRRGAWAQANAPICLTKGKIDE